MGLVCIELKKGNIKMVKKETKDIMKQREYCKKYREKHLNKDKKFFSVRLPMDEGTEIKAFIKEHNIPIKQMIEMGVEDMWEVILEKAN